jgi:hypothetical protein
MMLQNVVVCFVILLFSLSAFCLWILHPIPMRTCSSGGLNIVVDSTLSVLFLF